MIKLWKYNSAISQFLVHLRFNDPAYFFVKIDIYAFLSYCDLFGLMVITVYKFMTYLDTYELFRDI